MPTDKFYRSTAISAFNRIVKRLTRTGYNMTPAADLVQESEDTYTQFYKITSCINNAATKLFVVSDTAPHLDIRIMAYKPFPDDQSLTFNLRAKIEGTDFDWEGEDKSLLLLTDVFTEDADSDIINAYADYDYISEVIDYTTRLPEAFDKKAFDPLGDKVYNYDKYFFDANMKMGFMDHLLNNAQNLLFNAGLFTTKKEHTKGHAKYKITEYNTKDRKLEKLTDDIEFIIDQDYDMYDQSNGKADITIKVTVNGKNIVNIKETFDVTDRKNALTENKKIINSAINSMIDQLSKENIIKDHARISENRYATCSNVAKNVTNRVYEKLNKYFFNHIPEDMDNNSMHSMIDDVNEKIDVIMDALGLIDDDDDKDDSNNTTESPEPIVLGTSTDVTADSDDAANGDLSQVEIESNSVTPTKLATETRDRSLQDVIMNLRNNSSTAEEP